MSPVDDTRTRLTRLLDEVAVDIAALEAMAREMGSHLAEISGESVPRPWLALYATDLHGYYTAVEQIFERIARTLDCSLPEGASSHRELLRQMTSELPSVRPAVIRKDLQVKLHRLLSFRHFFRHAYDVELDAGEIRGHVTNVLGFHRELLGALGLLLDFVGKTRDSL